MSSSRGLLVGGLWRAAADGAERAVRDPATGEEVGRSAVAGPTDVDEAVAAALRAAPGWAGRHADERAAVLLAAAELVERRVDEIALMLTREQGKPIPDSRNEILFGARVLRFYAEEGRRVGGSLRASDRGDVKSVVSYAPVGVAGAIVPWNYPVDLYCWKVAPALAAGCPVIVKPPGQTPLAVGMVSECLLQAGVPAGALADLPGGADAGERLVAHPDVRMIAATASTATGRAIMRGASDTLKRLSLELGGQCPFVVLDDADLGDAAAGAARRSFSNMGQICIAVNRVLVADPIADELVEALAESTRAMRLGHGVQAGVEYGPVLDSAVRERVQGHVLDAVNRGARLVTGGRPPSGPEFDHGSFYLPTVLDHVPAGARVMCEESFGPVVAVHRVRDDAEALALADATPYGLAAYVYSRDLERAWAFADQVEAGAVAINVNDVTELQAPFGGWKLSGFGRELGREGLAAFLEPKHIRIRVRPLARRAGQLEDVDHSPDPGSQAKRRESRSPSAV